MKVFVELEVENCRECPNCKYSGEDWGEDIYMCEKTNQEVPDKGISKDCPFIEETLEKLHKRLEKLNG